VSVHQQHTHIFPNYCYNAAQVVKLAAFCTQQLQLTALLAAGALPGAVTQSHTRCSCSALGSSTTPARTSKAAQLHNYHTTTLR
jgi:hypothetical protein